MSSGVKGPDLGATFRGWIEHCVGRFTKPTIKPLRVISIQNLSQHTNFRGFLLYHPVRTKPTWEQDWQDLNVLSIVSLWQISI